MFRSQFTTTIDLTQRGTLKIEQFGDDDSNGVKISHDMLMDGETKLNRPFLPAVYLVGGGGEVLGFDADAYEW